MKKVFKEFLPILVIGIFAIVYLLDCLFIVYTYLNN